jgi:hypothetical protein
MIDLKVLYFTTLFGDCLGNILDGLCYLIKSKSTRMLFNKK